MIHLAKLQYSCALQKNLLEEEEQLQKVEIE